MCPEQTTDPMDRPSVAWRRIAEARKNEVRRLQGIILETIEEVQRIERIASQLESEGR